MQECMKEESERLINLFMHNTTVHLVAHHDACHGQLWPEVFDVRMRCIRCECVERTACAAMTVPTLLGCCEPHHGSMWPAALQVAMLKLINSWNITFANSPRD
jgi:hypothetical protein